MTNHPGDPRSNATGEQPYDPLEYPYRPFVPPAAPPGPGNVHNFIPGRGQVDHGVQITRDPDADTARDLPYVSDQLAQDRLNDPTVTPRDLVPVKPIPVVLVDRPDLLRRVKTITSTYRVPSNAQPIMIAPADPFRTRLVINVHVYESAMAYLTNSPDSALAETGMALGWEVATHETTTTDAVYAYTLATTPVNARLTLFGVWAETTQSNGDRLL